MNSFSVDNLVTPAMLAGYTNVSRPELYRSSCTQPIVSQPYPPGAVQTVFPSPAGGTLPAEDMYNRPTWYGSTDQVSPLEYQQQARYDNRSPTSVTCPQPPTPSFRDHYKPYQY